MQKSVAELRRDYTLQELSEAAADPNPIRQFAQWMEQAINAQAHEPNATTLATADGQGRPAARMVLLKGFDERGFVFYTNQQSRKAEEMAANPWAALVFWWGELERQVRIEGRVAPVPPEESDAYFASRPRGSQLGAWASPQSQVVGGREVLERRLAEVTARYEGLEVSRPPHWGGYRVAPDMLEFWQGRPSRLHDRLRYRLQESGDWVMERLAP